MWEISACHFVAWLAFTSFLSIYFYCFDLPIDLIISTFSLSLDYSLNFELPNLDNFLFHKQQTQVILLLNENWWVWFGLVDMQKKMEQEVVDAEIVLPTHLSFKRIQMYEKYPKSQSRSRHWKHLKQILQAENYQNYPPDEPTCKFLETFYSFPWMPEYHIINYFKKMLRMFWRASKVVFAYCVEKNIFLIWQ